MRRALSSATLAMLAVVGLLTAAGSGGWPNSADQVRSRLLAVADLPGGWSAAPVTPAGPQASTPCLSTLASASPPPASGYAAAAFAQGPAVPSLGEVLFTGAQGRQRWQRLSQALAGCHGTTATLAGRRTPVTVKPVAFPRVGTSSHAYAWTFTDDGIGFSTDLVTFDTGAYAGYITYSGLGIPSAALVGAFADAAAAKAASGSTAPVPDWVSVTSEPVRSALTPDLAAIAYREIGSGPPLVLIAGYGATMSSWDPRFVNALAQVYRVVIFDNPGTGGSSALPGPPSIDAMANQTSALITALGLDKPAVLGWSMGAMIAQALAVLHPDQVNRLVLCAGYPGDGTAVRPARQAATPPSTPDRRTVMADLFPAGQAGARNTYLAAIASYPPAPPVPAPVIAAQGQAEDAWWAGRDPAGRRTATIAAPALIADGAADLLDPAANSQRLAGIIPGAAVSFYPDAGHAFLFQDQAAFAPAVVAFLTTNPVLAAS